MSGPDLAVRCLNCRRVVDPVCRPMVLENTGAVICNPCAATARLGRDWLVLLDTQAFMFRVRDGGAS